jgi:hypothetical protein
MVVKTDQSYLLHIIARYCVRYKELWTKRPAISNISH